MRRSWVIMQIVIFILLMMSVAIAVSKLWL